MADFVSDFWHWFIIVGTLGGIFYCIILLIRNNGTEHRKDADGNVATTGHTWDEDVAEYDNPLPRWWANMYIMLCVFALGYLVLYPGLGHFQGVLGWSQKQQYEDEVDKVNQVHEPLFAFYSSLSVEELAMNKDAMKTGKRLFQTYCATCHGSDMRGNRGFPNLRDADWFYGGSSDAIKQTLINGRNGVMPAWEKSLGGDIDNIVQYVYSINENAEVRELVTMNSQEVAVGEKHFAANCMACHGADAKGVVGLAPNLVDNIWLHGGDYETLIDVIVNGRMGVMPSFNALLGESKIDVLTAYIYLQSGQLTDGSTDISEIKSYTAPNDVKDAAAEDTQVEEAQAQ